MNDKLTLEVLKRAVVYMREHQAMPQPFIVAVKKERAAAIANSFGAGWKPDSCGQQLIGQYLIVT